ncbi:cytochrome P450 [Microlunatus soli]|uniref:Cytochrome P450 n=1 Tax=Microlunatus soli TaxID=630515 RepID=A0A1H1R2X7_9ACTN|nr:cytochrome P450 [Microlunatus soli]SDS29885.1 Cytochrome P450 [Microlunatus soli]
MTTQTGEPLDFPIPRDTPLDPPRIYSELRRECPVRRVRLYNGRTPWLVTRYADVRTVLSDPRFSSVRSWPYQPSASRSAAERGEKSFTAMDPPEHTRFRKQLARYFSVKQVQALRPAVEQIVDRQLSVINAAEQPLDLVSRFAFPVASQAMCELIGVPYADHEWFESLAHVRSIMNADPDDADHATEELLDYVDRLVGQKLERRSGDLTSRLVTDLLEPGLVAREELVPIIRLLLTAGYETTATMIGTGVFVLLNHPDQLERVRTDRTLLPGTVEELLRYISMLHTTIVRVAKQRVDLGGSRVEPGDGMIVTPAAANKDPDRFPDPDHFDITRDARGHIAFGYGVHQCLGQQVARLELEIVFDRLLDRLPGLRLAVDPDRVEFNDSNLVGVAALPVAW